MKCNVKVSIIVPVYNAEAYVEECLDSAISQTIPEKEIICVDDGSSDRSYDILQRYQRQYSYIKVLQQANKGAGEARNVGLKNAAGKYVSFLDADDFYLDQEALERMVSVCENENVQICAGLRKVLTKGELTEHFLYRNYFEDGKNSDGVVVQYSDYQDDYFYQNYIFSMELIRKNDIWFPLYRRYQDAPFFVNVMLAAVKYKVLPIEFYGYRLSDKALNRKGTYVEDILRGIRENALTAQKYHLDKLKTILAYRIADEYSSWIINEVNDEVLQLLREIQETLFNRNCRESEDSDILESSFEIVRSIAAGNLKGYHLGSYFEKKGIASVAVYGLGHYGKMAVSEIRKSDKIEIYGIDQRIQELEGVEIGTLNAVNRKCATVIVTPARDNHEIVNSIKMTWNGNVWALYELVHKVESGDWNAG